MRKRGYEIVIRVRVGCEEKQREKRETQTHEIRMRHIEHNKWNKWNSCYLAWAKASLAKAEGYGDRNVEATSRVTSDCSLTKCVIVLDEMEDIPHDAYGKTLEKFMNPDWREVFIAMSVERKRGWVLTRIDIDESDDSTSDASDDEFAEFLFNSMLYNYHQKYFNKAKVLTSSLTGREFVAEVLNGSGTSCFDLFRMKKECFINFCNELREKNYLCDSRDVFVEEKVATFLFIIGHNVRHRVASIRFQHSTETISRNFKEVLREYKKVIS
ncbi:hypothetical protein KIW84_025108 [Lathyrus oleraceus]|uniref:DUF8040 domain-containing protein n=1 Tax=Pisum sativum TaxID=3888 RepID=A0A9D4YN62_PEA|nr:hypothetical protein KIW84_025108 [Pisum sativum]